MSSMQFMIQTAPESMAERAKRKLENKVYKIQRGIQNKFLTQEELLWDGIYDEDMFSLAKMKKLILKNFPGNMEIPLRKRPFNRHPNETATHMILGGDAKVKTIEMVKLVLDEMKKIGTDKKTGLPPRALRMVTTEGETPLHMACSINFSRNDQPREEKVVCMIFETYKSMGWGEMLCSMKTKTDGLTPFHLMCYRKHYNTHSFILAIDAYPGVMAEVDVKNNTPLNLCVKYHPSFEVNEYLIRRYEPVEAIYLCDNVGQNPLHSLCKTMDDRAARLIPILLERAPMLAFVLDKKQCLPHDYVAANAAPKYKNQQRCFDTMQYIYHHMKATALSLIGSITNLDPKINALLKDTKEDDSGRKFCCYIKRNERFRELVMGLNKMNTVGRHTSNQKSSLPKQQRQQQEGTIEEGIKILGAAPNNLDCLYHRIRENPSKWM